MDPALHEKWKYDDPNLADKGILLSNQIHELCEQGLLIADGFYRKENLRPASYTLTIGDDYIDSEGKVCRLSEDEDSFVFEKNSIVFVSIREKLDLPYYIIARFNLRVNWVYDGILLGTGPQVDPGYFGFLSCPLYNLTNSDITIRREQPFATIDFEKTTTLLAGQPLEQKKDSIGKARDKGFETIKGQTYSFYKTSPLVPLQLTKSHKMVSSLLELREEVRTWRRLGIGSAIAFFGLTLSLLAFGANLYRQNSDASRQLMEGKSELQDTKQRVSALQNEVQDAKQQIAALQANIDRLSSDLKQILIRTAPSPPQKGTKKSP